ncbi:MAG: cytochrome c oxidase assembly protein [Gemmataceae bacterium]
MNPIVDAFLSSWVFDPWVIVPLLLTAAIYYRGWRMLRQRGAPYFDGPRLAAFLAGIVALLIALVSPLEPFASMLLQVHMLQHLLLMFVAPPLLLFGAPLLPLLRGLPAAMRRHWVAPLARWEVARGLFRWLTHPVVAWLLFVILTWLWHIPRLYDLALRSPTWHIVEHLCFFGGSVLFWWPVVQPYPSRPQVSRWWLVPYLLLAGAQMTALSAVLTYTNHVLYPHYETVPRLGGVSALEDQALAGVLMWVPGSIVLLLAIVWVGVQLLTEDEEWTPVRLALVRDQRFACEPSASTQESRIRTDQQGSRIALPVIELRSKQLISAWNALDLPLIGPFLRWRHVRLALQVLPFALAGLIIYDGWFGPPIESMNLAGVLPWIHWRGLVVLGLLVAGNVFCLACPFLVPRAVARRWLPAHHAWPRWLRSKWLAVGWMVLFFWSYEAFALWASPWWTAWIAVGYFGAAFVVDGWFRGAAFCKYLCPIGQFNFVQSLLSPLEVKVRDPRVCQTCATKDCIRGNDIAPGCELHLYQPRKASNVDCTFCLDCVHACPHDNIGIAAVPPGKELLHDPPRSGIGRFSRRLDLAALVLVLVFAAFVNASGMVAPVVETQDQLADALGLASARPVVMASLAFGLLLLPVLAVVPVAWLSRWWGGNSDSIWIHGSRFVYALAPLGFGMWLAHYSFHFLTSYGSIVPVSQRLAADLGGAWGEPQWACGCCVTVADWLLRLEILFLDAGLWLSLYAAYRTALRVQPDFPLALKTVAPWAVLMLLLFAWGIWLLFQPMQMRGMM